MGTRGSLALIVSQAETCNLLYSRIPEGGEAIRLKPLQWLCMRSLPSDTAAVSVSHAVHRALLPSPLLQLQDIILFRMCPCAAPCSSLLQLQHTPLLPSSHLPTNLFLPSLPPSDRCSFPDESPALCAFFSPFAAATHRIPLFLRSTQHAQRAYDSPLCSFAAVLEQQAARPARSCS